MKFSLDRAGYAVRMFQAAATKKATRYAAGVSFAMTVFLGAAGGTTLHCQDQKAKGVKGPVASCEAIKTTLDFIARP